MLLIPQRFAAALLCLVAAVPIAAAQDDGPLMFRNGATIEVTKRDRTRPTRPTGDVILLSVGDRVTVQRGESRICFAELHGPNTQERGGECSQYGTGTYIIMAYEAPSSGLLVSVARRLQEIAGLVFGEQRITRVPFVSRDGDPRSPTLPPTLLFPADSARTLDARVHLLWLPAQIDGVLTPTRVRMYSRPSPGCAGGEVVADTTLETGPLDLAALAGPLERGTRVRVRLEAASGDDDGCVSIGTAEDAEETTQEIRRLLDTLGGTDDENVLAHAAALDRLGYPYDALVLLDRERLAAGPLIARGMSVQQAWGALLERVGAAD